MVMNEGVWDRTKKWEGKLAESVMREWDGWEAHEVPIPCNVTTEESSEGFDFISGKLGVASRRNASVCASVFLFVSQRM